MLEVKNIVAGYGGITVLNGISIYVPEGKIISIVGSNGAGKSTLLKAITGLIKPISGEILFDGKRVDGQMPHQTLQDGISMVPEGRQLFTNLTVLENLEIGSTLPQNRANRKENLEEVYRLFPKLKEREKQLAGTLSGGEQQMVAMARALMSNPRLLILDEPSWGLAPLLVTELFDAIKVIKDKGTAILIVEQNVHKALSFSDWGYVIECGQLVMEGIGGELLENPDLKKAYLGI